MIELGALSIWLALLMSWWGVLAGAAGVLQRRGDLLESASRAVVAAGFFVTLALAGLLDALLGVDLTLRYVARHVTTILPTTWRVAALWSGVEGRVLVWAFCVVVATGALAIAVRRRDAYARGRISTMMAALLAVAVSLAAVGANAFVRLTASPIDGAGLPPLLRDPGFLAAPPLVLLGCALTLPLGAQAGAAFLARRVTNADLCALRAWARAAFTVLSMGLAAWLWWNASVQDNNGGWIVDALAAPVFVPWLVLVMALHALARTYDGRGADVARVAVVLAGAASLLSLLVPIAPMVPSSARDTSSADWSRIAAWLAVSFCIIALARTGARVRVDLPTREQSRALSRHAVVARLAGPLAHAGIAIVLVALAGAMFRSEREVVLRVGEPTSVRDPYGLHWQLVAQGISRVEAADGGVLALGVQVQQGNGTAVLISSEARAWVDGRGVPVGEPYVTDGVHGSALEQVRVRLVEVVDERRSRVRVIFVPLAWLMWLGATCIVGAGALALWPAAQGGVAGNAVPAPWEAPPT